jgi:hypothetical protein
MGSINALILLLVAFPAIAADPYSHGAWELTGDERVAGAQTQDQTGSRVAFMVLLAYQDCGQHRFALALPEPGYLGVSTDTTGRVEMRINGGEPHRTQLLESGRMGTGSHLLLFADFADSDRLYADLKAGAKLRLRLFLGGRAFDLYFSLLGSKAIIGRMEQACRFAASTRDRDQELNLLKGLSGDPPKP